MIYLHKTSEFVEIPRYEGVSYEKYLLTFINTLTHTLYKVDNLKDISAVNQLYKFNINNLIPELPDGEYIYTLLSDENVLASGLMQFGDYVNTVSNYDKNIKIITYEK